MGLGKLEYICYDEVVSYVSGVKILNSAVQW